MAGKFNSVFRKVTSKRKCNMYFYVDDRDIVIASTEELEYNLDMCGFFVYTDEEISDFRYVDDMGQVLASSDNYKEILYIQRKLKGVGTVRVVV